MTSYIKLMRSSIFISVFLLFSFTLNPPNPKKWQIDHEATLVASDSLGKLYQIDNKAIVKYSKEGKQIANYALLNTGAISSIDTRNALQTMLFFNEQQEIILLDNMLGLTRKIQLADYFDWIDLACFSNRDNAFWFYSISNQSLIKTNKDLQVIAELNNIGQLLSIDLNPVQLLERNENIYLLDPENGIIIFDIFGNYKSKISIRNISKIEVNEPYIYYLSNNSIYSYQKLTFDKQNIVQHDSIVDFCIFGVNLYAQDVKKLTRIELIENE